MTFRYASRGICAATVAAALVLQPLAAYAAAIAPALAQVPLQGVNPVKPNLMFTLDDSGSMAFEFVPDYVGYYTSVAATGNHYFCLNQNDFPTALATGRLCGQLGGTWGGNPTAAPGISDPPLRSSNFNHQYYDPAIEYPIAVNELRNALDYEVPATAGTWTQVYSDGFDNYVPPPATFTPAVKVNLTNAYPDTVWCWRSGTPTAAQIATAAPGGDGSACRRNGYAYPGNAAPNATQAVSAGYNYPNRSDGKYCQGGTTVGTPAVFDCPTQSAATAVAPYYYKISKVQFCASQDTSASPSLNRGFGKGNCSPQPPEDLTLSSRWHFTDFPYVRYGTDPNNAFEPGAFTRVDIKPTGFLVNGVVAPNPTGRTYAQEMANFAKWYAFYRTRINSMKTATGLAFTVLDSSNARVGYHTIWKRGFQNVLPFDATNKSNWFKLLYNSTVSGGTPLPDAMWRIGQLFSNPNAGVGSWTNTSGISGATDPVDPVTGACQDNFHLLSTDGYWNKTLDAAAAASGVLQGTGSVKAGDRDKTVPDPANLPGPIVSAYPPNPAFIPGSNFPGGYYEGPVAISNNLADLGMKYWINDIRNDHADRVGLTGAQHPWQKLVFYGLSLGAQGNIRYIPGKPDSVVLKDIIDGTRNWPSSPKQPPNVDASGNVQDAGAEAVDDLWHAAVNGRGGFASADTPLELAKAIANILSQIILQTGTGTGVSTNGGQLSLANKYGYKTRYNDPDPVKDWSGDVRKYPLDLTTGEVLPTLIWSAKAKLDAQAAVVGTVKGWDTGRRIATMSGTTPIPFRWSSLSGAQKTSLTAGWTGVLPLPNGSDVLDYLRGDPSHYGTGVNDLRGRTHILGDIVLSAAVPVGPPNLPYEDATNPGYSGFKSAKASRMPMVYVGANDGMLHAFLDPTSETDPTGGTESWAYVPSALFSGDDPNDSTHTPSPDFSLGALAYQIGGIPLFKHKSYVNATPRVWDVDVHNTNISNVSGPPALASDSDWRTILVGALGVGGRAVYALDVTDPVATTEADAVGKVLWEFNTVNAAPKGDPNLGYVYDAPTVVKTRAKGWVTLIVSGYNNAGGKGFLYVVNPKTGDLIKKISLPGDNGTDIAPTGLSTVRAFVASRKDPYVTQAYGGDLKGNVWRFDLSAPDTANWKAEKIAALTDKNGKAQPITAGIRIEIDQNNSNRYLFVGTGKLLGQPDVGATTVWNTMYVIRDGNVAAPDPKPATPYSRTSTAPDILLPVAGTSLTGFTGTLGRGWYQDAAAADWYIVNDPFADLQTAVYAFAKPATDPCAPPLSAILFAREFTSGDSVLQALGSTTIIASAEITEGVAGLQLVQGAESPTGAMPVSAQITNMGGQVFSYGIKLGVTPSGRHRVSWRVLNN